jgi:hypothetical protein
MARLSRRLKPPAIARVSVSSALEFRGIHRQFLEDTTPTIDFEGGRMSGKTWAVCAKIVLSCLEHPGILWLICRYSNETTRTMVRPIFIRIAQMYGVDVVWNDDESAFHFPIVDGKLSKVYAYGLKSQTIAEALSKVRGLDLAGIANDQSEETPQAIAEELPFGTRQAGYPHQVIFSPNPPTEDHFLCDMFPEENPFPNRKYYRASLYDNAHNIPESKIRELEDAYPPTHAKHKSLILGMRGPNIIGVPVYEHMFSRSDHLKPVRMDSTAKILEAIDTGKHHPVWMVAQRTPFGLNLLGGVIGKRMFLEDFLPVVDYYRAEWFDAPRDQFRLCCDPPPSAEDGQILRYTHLNILRDWGLSPTYRPNANAPDVRESIIQHIAGLMRRRSPSGSALAINADPLRWLSVSSSVTKQSNWFIDGLEGSYVWDDNLVSVANKKVRQPKSDQWIDGWQRCFENITLNFCATAIEPEPEPERRPYHPLSTWS